MMLDSNRMDRIAQAQELRERGESARRRDGSMALKTRRGSCCLVSGGCTSSVLAHTIRHLGDVYLEDGSPELAEPCYHEALELYRCHEGSSSLDLANAVRSLAVLRWEQARALWDEARSFTRP